MSDAPENEQGRPVVIDLNHTPLTIVVIHEIVRRLCTDGEVGVVHCQIDSALPARLLSLMSARLSDAGKDWLLTAMRNDGWVTRDLVRIPCD